MPQRNGVSPQDLVQEQKKNPFKKAKWIMFRGPPHQLAPSSKNNNVQQLDLKGQEDSIPARPKMEVKDVGGPSCVRSLPSTLPNNSLAFPLIKREQSPPVSLKSHPKGTLACPGQRVDAAPKRTSKLHSIVATECETSSKRALEPSSLWSLGEASAAQRVTPVSAMKRFSYLWKRSTKISPAVPTEFQTASRDLSEPSLDWAQGETSPVSTIKAISGPWKRKPKIYPAMTNESKASQKVASEPLSNWSQGENPPLQEVLRVTGIKGVSAPHKKKPNVYPTLPIISKKSPKVETSSNWPKREASASQEANPFYGIQVVITRRKKSTQVSPGLPTEHETSSEIIFESSYNLLQELCAASQKGTTPCPPKTSGPWKTRAKLQQTSSPQSEPLPGMVTKNCSQSPQEKDCEQQSPFGAFIENLQQSGLKDAYRALLISPRKRNKFVSERE